ncbi:MAG: glycoside hydrolase family 3 N-terminal domain-containing protein [Sphingomonadales bacterium]
MRVFLTIVLLGFSSFYSIQAQSPAGKARQRWVDSVFASLTEDQRIAQLMVVRAHSNLGPEHIAKVERDIIDYNVGALCFFQGGPLRQAILTNRYQQVARTPLLVTIDGEWGLGMRLDSVTRFPYQLTLGALQDENLVYRMGVAVGEQCKRIGVHVNYAPVVDVNNNPDNPVIGFRSFGEDRDKVSRMGVAYMKGMQDAGIMACAKHFPGHGDVAVDSHYDLPVINKSMSQLDSMELVPFRALFAAGVGSVMVAHLAIPAIDTAAHRATSISRNNVTELLRNKLQYKGLTFTDALEMKGVASYFPGGTISVEAIIAGNDMLCLPASVPESIAAIKAAIQEGRLQQTDVDSKVKKVLQEKYNLGLYRPQFVDTTQLVADLNAATDVIREEVARKGLTVLSKAPASLKLPLQKGDRRLAYIQLGGSTTSVFGKQLQTQIGADLYSFSLQDSTLNVDSVVAALKTSGRYDLLLIGLQGFSNKPMNNFGIGTKALQLHQALQSDSTISIVFGNVQALKQVCDARFLVAAYQDDDITQTVASQWLLGEFAARGVLPVSVCNFPFGSGLQEKPLPISANRKNAAFRRVDAVVNSAMAQRAFPGCVVLAVHKGEILFHKAYGYYDYEQTQPLTPESIFDLASVTKVSATTVAVMKLYEQGKLRLEGRLGEYLPWVRGSNKQDLLIRDILLHQAGLVPFIPFYKETLQANGVPDTSIFSPVSKPGFTRRVAEKLFVRNDWQDSVRLRILQSPLGVAGNYVYSDNDFIFLGHIVEQLSGKSLEAFCQENFYRPMGMYATGFTPRNRFAVDRLVPTETEKNFRRQTTRGDVHDEGAALMGGVAGHAGLFSNAYDLAILYQLLLNKGVYQGRRYLQPETIRLFTDYQRMGSRRGLGFDKPEVDNRSRKDPYPSLWASAATFGHTGFTGTCVWADPQQELVYVFLSNRVNPTRDNNKLAQLGVRGKIQDALYCAIGADE